MVAIPTQAASCPAQAISETGARRACPDWGQCMVYHQIFVYAYAKEYAYEWKRINLGPDDFACRKTGGNVCLNPHAHQNASGTNHGFLRKLLDIFKLKLVFRAGGPMCSSHMSLSGQWELAIHKIGAGFDRWARGGSRCPLVTVINWIRRWPYISRPGAVCPRR